MRLNPAEAMVFAFAGHAIFTLASKRTGARFTYRLVAKKNSYTTYWLSVLCRPDNNTGYRYAGRVDFDKWWWAFRTTDGSLIKRESPSLVAFCWALSKGFDDPNLEFWHEGRCGCCGRRLTTPESISVGIGPKCQGRRAA
jgi:hypothetical protein